MDIKQKNTQDLPKVYLLKPDSVSLDLANENTLVAIFKHKEHAHMFGRMMWGKHYIIEEAVDTFLFK